MREVGRKMRADPVFGASMPEDTEIIGVDADGWSANVQADELAGDLSYRSGDGGKLIARLSRLRIPEDAPGHEAGAQSGAKEVKDLPALDLIADRFTFRGKQYDHGLAWVHFPEGYGGLGVSPGLQTVVADELAKHANTIYDNNTFQSVWLEQ